MTAYEQLEKHFHTLYQLDGAMGVLYWDHATYMPRGSNEVRSEQLATLSQIHHEKLCAPKMADLLDAAEAATPHLELWQRRNLELMRREYRHASALPADLVEKMIKAGLECEHIWQDARDENDFARYEPYQQTVLELAREAAELKAEALGCSPYDALLDQYDEGWTVDKIDAIFDPLAEFLADFIPQAVARSQQHPATSPKAPFDVAKQRELSHQLMTQLGFPFDQGRVDESAHPFCGGVSGDVRITTKFKPDDLFFALMGTLHETGHALYEANLPKKWRGQPVGNALGMSVHESQSLFVEMQICRSRGFVEFLAPKLQAVFGDDAAFGDDNLYRLYNKVEPDFVRIDADEVTYPAHVILRYGLEKELISGALQIKDVPERWNAEMKRLLGVDVPDPARGCMQDVHWTDGSFGYFPTYTLGAMMAAQWMAGVKRDVGDIDEQLARGDFSAINSWLKDNVHQHGSCYRADELLQKSTGKSLSPEYYIAHLKERYL